MNSPWFSLLPLALFNIFMLATAVAFRPVYRKMERMDIVESRHSSKLLNKWMREYWRWLTNPAVKFLIKLKLSPNAITTMGVLISAISAVFFWFGNFGLGGWFMIIAATFDMFDGEVARETGRETKSGCYYDSVMDRVSESLVFVGMAHHYINHWALWVVITTLFATFMVSYTRSKGESVGIHYEGGTMQRPERIVYLGVGAIFAPVFAWILTNVHPIFTASHLYLLPLIFVGLMCLITTVDRIYHVMKMLDAKENQNKTISIKKKVVNE